MRVLRALWRHLRGRRTTEHLEPCEAPRCGRLLRPHETWELTEHPSDDDALEIGFGGTYMTSTFCAEHAPPNSVQVRVARRRHP